MEETDRAPRTGGGKRAREGGGGSRLAEADSARRGRLERTSARAEADFTLRSTRDPKAGRRKGCGAINEYGRAMKKKDSSIS